MAKKTTGIKTMILPDGYVAGSDSMYLHIIAPTPQAALNGMRKYMDKLDWSKDYVEYIAGTENVKHVDNKTLKHLIEPVKTTNGWILEVPNTIAAKICNKMGEWLESNPNRKQSVDLLTKEQMQALMLSEVSEVII